MIRDPAPENLDDSLPDEGADILVIILRRVMVLAPDVDRELLTRIDAEVRAAYGGLRVRIPKRGKYLSPAERQAVYRDALTNAPTEEILRKHKISARSLRRWLKQGEP